MSLRRFILCIVAAGALSASGAEYVAATATRNKTVSAPDALPVEVFTNRLAMWQPFYFADTTNFFDCSPASASLWAFATNAPAFSNAFGGCLSFNNVTTHLRNGALGITNDFTLSIWVRPVHLTNSPIVFYKLTATNGFLLVLTAAGKPRFDMRPGGGYITGQTGTAEMVSNVWQHVAVTRTNANVKVYLNGIQQTQTNSSAGSIHDSLVLSVGGADGSGGSTARAMVGLLDEPLIFHAGLPSNVVFDVLYTSRKSRYGL